MSRQILLLVSVLSLLLVTTSLSQASPVADNEQLDDLQILLEEFQHPDQLESSLSLLESEATSLTTAEGVPYIDLYDFVNQGEETVEAMSMVEINQRWPSFSKMKEMAMKAASYTPQGMLFNAAKSALNSAQGQSAMGAISGLGARAREMLSHAAGKIHAGEANLSGAIGRGFAGLGGWANKFKHMGLGKLHGLEGGLKGGLAGLKGGLAGLKGKFGAFAGKFGAFGHGLQGKLGAFGQGLAGKFNAMKDKLKAKAANAKKLAKTLAKGGIKKLKGFSSKTKALLKKALGKGKGALKNLNKKAKALLAKAMASGKGLKGLSKADRKKLKKLLKKAAKKAKKKAAKKANKKRKKALKDCKKNCPAGPAGKFCKKHCKSLFGKKKKSKKGKGKKGKKKKAPKPCKYSKHTCALINISKDKAKKAALKAMTAEKFPTPLNVAASAKARLKFNLAKKAADKAIAEEEANNKLQNEADRRANSMLKGGFATPSTNSTLFLKVADPRSKGFKVIEVPSPKENESPITKETSWQMKDMPIRDPRTGKMTKRAVRVKVTNWVQTRLVPERLKVPFKPTPITAFSPSIFTLATVTTNPITKKQVIQMTDPVSRQTTTVKQDGSEVNEVKLGIKKIQDPLDPKKLVERLELVNAERTVKIYKRVTLPDPKWPGRKVKQIVGIKIPARELNRAIHTVKSRKKVGTISTTAYHGKRILITTKKIRVRVRSKLRPGHFQQKTIVADVPAPYKKPKAKRKIKAIRLKRPQGETPTFHWKVVEEGIDISDAAKQYRREALGDRDLKVKLLPARSIKESHLRDGRKAVKTSNHFIRKVQKEQLEFRNDDLIHAEYQ